jgi:ADP-ribose pyrophosphatase YjhB (NUDIX family)
MITLQVGVKAFLKNTDGKYLLLHRSSEKYKGTKGSWDIVGGRIDPGSPLMENLKREVAEETQLKIISEPKLIYAQDIILTEKERHIVRLTFTALTDGQPILDTSESVEFRWLSIEEFKKQEDLDIYVKEILEKGILK